jgi:hypothetical protein
MFTCRIHRITKLIVLLCVAGYPWLSLSMEEEDNKKVTVSSNQKGRKRKRKNPVILVTGPNSIPTAIAPSPLQEAMQLGQGDTKEKQQSDDSFDSLAVYMQQRSQDVEKVAEAVKTPLEAQDYVDARNIALLRRAAECGKVELLKALLETTGKW